MRCGLVVLFAVLSPGLGAAVPLTTTHDVQVQENFDVNQYLGTWFSIGAGCNCSWFIKYKKLMTISKILLSTTEEMNKLHSKFVYDRNGTCVNVSVEYEMFGSPGHYKFTSSSAYDWSGDFQVVETNYHEYAFIFFRGKGMNETKSVALYGRTRKLRKEIHEQFKAFALKQGIPEDMVLFLPEQGACVPWDPIPDSVVKDRARRTLGAEDEEGSAFEPVTNKTRRAESCQLFPDTGACFALFSRFYYNHTSMTCERFNYGGCLGNRNNFKSERECLQTCRTVAACRLPIEAGPCKSIVDLWAFDSVIGKCVVFKYSGCQGNGNKFYTRKECEEYCDVVPEGEDDLLAVPKKV